MFIPRGGRSRGGSRQPTYAKAARGGDDARSKRRRFENAICMVGLSTLQQTETLCFCDKHFNSGSRMASDCDCCMACAKRTDGDHKPDSLCAYCVNHRVLDGHKGVTGRAASTGALAIAVRTEVALIYKPVEFENAEKRAETVDQKTTAMLALENTATKAFDAAKAIANLETETDRIDKVGGEPNATPGSRRDRKRCAATQGSDRRAGGARGREGGGHEAQDRPARRRHQGKRGCAMLTEAEVAGLQGAATATGAALKTFYAANLEDPAAEIYVATLKPFALRLELEDKNDANARGAKIRARRRAAQEAAGKEAAPKEQAPDRRAGEGERGRGIAPIFTCNTSCTCTM